MWSNIGWMLTGICLYALLVPTHWQVVFQDHMDDLFERIVSWSRHMWILMKDKYGQIRK